MGTQQASCEHRLTNYLQLLVLKTLQVSGQVDQSAGMLDESAKAKGYALLCVSEPKSDCRIQVIDEVRSLPLYRQHPCCRPTYGWNMTLRCVLRRTKSKSRCSAHQKTLKGLTPILDVIMPFGALLYGSLTVNVQVKVKAGTCSMQALPA